MERAYYVHAACRYIEILEVSADKTTCGLSQNINQALTKSNQIKSNLLLAKLN